MRNDLEMYEKNHVLASVVKLNKEFASMPKKVFFEKLERDHIKLQEDMRYSQEDIKGQRDNENGIRNELLEYKAMTNNDLGRLQGKDKWAEDQINMLKNLLKHLKDSKGLKGSRSDTSENGSKTNLKAMTGDYAIHVEHT